MSNQSIVLHLDERWYNALSRQLDKADMTVEGMLDDYLDKLIDRLPEQMRETINREIWDEDWRQREAAEAAQPISVFRVTQGGRTDYLLTEGGASMDVLHTAMRLRAYLLAKGNSPQQFIQAIPVADYITSEVFQDYADELRERTGHVIAALDIDLDRSEFSTLDVLNGWETYAIRDVSMAAWHANRNDSLRWEQRLEIFAGRLEGLEIVPPDRLVEQDSAFSEGWGVTLSG